MGTTLAPMGLARPLDISLNPSHRAELQSLLKEGDSELLYQGLSNLAGRLERAGQAEPAARIYSAILEGLPEGIQDALRRQAQSRLNGIEGKGDFGARAEFLLSRFTKEAFDPKVIAPMMLGTSVFTLSRSLALGRLGSSALFRALGPRFAASSLGFAAEVPAFALSARALRPTSSQDPSIGQDLAGAAITLGFLKTFGFGAETLSTSPIFRHASRLQQQAFSQAAIFAGLLAAHQVEERIGLRTHVDDATTITDTLAAMFSLGIGANLSHRTLGNRLAAWQGELNARFMNHAAQAESLNEMIASPMLMASVGGGSGSSRPPKPDRIGEGEPAKIVSTSKALTSGQRAWLKRAQKTFGITFSEAEILRLIKSRQTSFAQRIDDASAVIFGQRLMAEKPAKASKLAFELGLSVKQVLATEAHVKAQFFTESLKPALEALLPNRYELPLEGQRFPEAIVPLLQAAGIQRLGQLRELSPLQLLAIEGVDQSLVEATRVNMRRWGGDLARERGMRATVSKIPLTKLDMDSTLRSSLEKAGIGNLGAFLLMEIPSMLRIAELDAGRALAEQAAVARKWGVPIVSKKSSARTLDWSGINLPRAGFSGPLLDILEAAGIRSISALRTKSVNDLLQLPRFNLAAGREVSKVLNQWGLSLKSDANWDSVPVEKLEFPEPILAGLRKVGIQKVGELKLLNTGNNAEASGLSFAELKVIGARLEEVTGRPARKYEIDPLEIADVYPRFRMNRDLMAVFERDGVRNISDLKGKEPSYWLSLPGMTWEIYQKLVRSIGGPRLEGEDGWRQQPIDQLGFNIYLQDLLKNGGYKKVGDLPIESLGKIWAQPWMTSEHFDSIVSKLRAFGLRPPHHQEYDRNIGGQLTIDRLGFDWSVQNRLQSARIKTLSDLVSPFRNDVTRANVQRRSGLTSVEMRAIETRLVQLWLPIFSR